MLDVVEPYPFQAECINEIDWFNGRPLLALPPGLGKTLISYFWTERHADTAYPVVAVCPAPVKYVWEKEAARLGISTECLSGRTPRRLTGAQVTVLNYDIAQYWVKRLQSMRPRTVIIDECHKIANQTKQAEAVKQLCKGVPYVLALSGTPMVNRPIELFTVVNLLRPGVFSSRMLYAHEFCQPQLTSYGWRYNGVTNADKLHRLLTNHCMIRRRKEDVLADLPSKLRDAVPVELSDYQEYQFAEEDFLAWLRSIDPAAARRAARAEAFTRASYLLSLVGRLKVRAVVSWISEWLDSSGSDKLVVFTRHRAMAAALREQYGGRCVVIEGGATDTSRSEALSRFQRDTTCRLFVGNLQAAGTGLDGLQEVSNTIAFAELWWSAGTMLQAEDRCHRIGAKDTVWCHYLVADGTIEERVQRILVKRQQTLNAVLDGDNVETGGDVLDQLLEEMRG